MNTKLILATLAGAISSFLLGWLVYGILLMDMMNENTFHYASLAKKEPPNLIALFLSNVCWAGLYAWIFQKWANVSTFTGGIKTGFLISVPFSLGYLFSMHAFFNLYTRQWLITDTFVSIAFFTLIAGIIGAVLGMGKNKPTS